MSYQERNVMRRWAEVVAIAALLTVLSILLGGQPVAAEEGTFPQQPTFDRLRPTLSHPTAFASRPGIPQALESRRSSPEGQAQINPGFTLDLVYDALWGLVSPGDLVTATRTADGAYAAGEADGVGFFWSYFWLDNGQPADIAAGDSIDVYVNGTLAATLNPLAISGDVEVLSDEVSGNVTGLAAGTPVTVTMGEFGWMPTDEPQVVTTVDGSGDLNADFTGIADLGPHSSAQVQYRDANGHTIEDCVYPSEVFRVANWQAVEGYAAPGSTVTVTVYITYPSDVRWSQTVDASTPQGFYGAYDDIEYGDMVEVDLGGGTLVSVTASYLEIWPDAATDQIGGWADVAAGTPVRGYILDQFEGFYAEATDTVDSSGNFNLTFAADLRTGHWPYVAYADAEGDEVGYSVAPPHLRAYPYTSGLYAVADAPNQPVTYTVNTGSELWTQYGWCGKSNTCEWAYFDSLEPGYIITAEFPASVNVMEVADVSMEPDTAGDGVSGEANIPGQLDVTICQWNGGPINGCGVGATTASSSYAITFPGFDVRDGMQLWIYHYDAVNGNRTFAMRGTWETAFFEVYPWGVGGAPPHADEHVTAYLYDTDGTTLLASTDADNDGDPWRFWFDDFAGYSLDPGYWVTLTADSGWTSGLQVPFLTVETDAATDLIWGEAPKSTVLVDHEWPDGWEGRSVPVDGYVLDRAYFGGDIQNGDRVYATYQHLNGNRVRAEHALGEVFRAQFWFELNDDTWMWGEAQAGSTVTVTTPLTQVYAYSDPNCNGCWDVYVGQLYPGDNVSVVASPGNDPVNLTIPVPFSAEADSGLGDVWGQIGGWVSQTVEIHGGWDNGYQEVTTNLAGNYLAHYDNMPRGADGYIRFVDQYNYTQVIFHRHFRSPDLLLNVNYGHDWAEVETMPGSTVTVTVAGKGTVVGQAGMDGWFRSNDWPWDPERPDFEPGDVVTATAIGLEATVNPIGTIEGLVDADADTVSGLIYAPFPTVTVQCEVWIEGGGPTIVITDVNGSGGSYECDYGAVGWDIQPGQSYAVRYFEPDGDTVINVFEPPWMRVNYGDDWVGGTYPAGHTFWITVTDEFDTPKGYAQIDSVPGGGWGGDGFETRDEDWLTGRPDIQPWNRVYARADDGYTHSIQVGDITGDVDVDENTISGTITADFTQTLYVRCEVWVENGPDGIDTTAEPDGGSYFCDFDDVGWDLLPGQTVSVRYHEPDDNDAVINIFREPAPNMYIEKWAEGSGQVAPGGPVVFGLRCRNDGSVAATTVYLTDTLPANTTYVTDTSGFPATIVGNQVVWTFGPVAPQTEARFQLVLNNTASEDDTLVNQADIWSLYDEDPDNNHAEAQAQVVGAGEQPDLWVNKNPDPGDPAPGQTMVWQINYGNNGPVPSGQVILTDTIPDGTSIVSWFSDNGYHLWTEHSTADQFILEAPSIPGWWSDRIYLRLYLEPGLGEGTQLTNTVEITTANDSDPGNNWHQRNDVWTGNERWNASMDKNMDWGELVPGGYVVYNLNVHNNGNMAAHTWLTDTLPAGTSFVESWIWTGGGEQPFPPTSVDATTVVWDLGEMQPAEWYNIGARLAIDGGLDSGIFFTNCAEITIDGPDNSPRDNAKCAVERLNEPGTNLRVNKEYQWEGDGVIRYDIYIQNLGTTRLEPVWVTDAYPEGLSFNGDWWVGHGPWITMTHDAQNRELTFWYQQLDPGGTSRVYYRLDMDAPGTQGLCFTNAAESPQPGDVWSADNYADVTACTGPDVYVEKWLSGGEPRPGEIVTFTVEFGNRNVWPWNGDDQYGSHITDTLPAGMTFITATAPWDPNQIWYPEVIDGNTIVWGFGTLWADNWWQFDVVAQITGPVQDGDVLVNTVEVYGDSPDDVEYDYNNNVFQLPVTIEAPDFQVAKSYESSAVAGTLVTYTLVVTNVGTDDGTSVILSDTLPAGLTYGGGDGTFNGTDVTWSLGTIAANGGTASGWFSATLACTGVVLNEDYGVASSDQGITNLDGDPVSLTIIAPTLTPAFEQSATEVDLGQTVTFSDTSTTNGSTIVAWSWDFGDGGSASGATVSHAYNAPNSYDVTLTITDACGYSDSVTVVDAVTIAQYRIFLPIVLRND